MERKAAALCWKVWNTILFRMLMLFTVSYNGNVCTTADSSKQLNAWYHSSGLVLAALTPIALIISPYKINMPVDLALGFIFPFHSHVALNYIISDYVPKAARSVARASLLLATLTAAAGILKLNVQGPGLTEALKSLWLKPKK